jgi:membrane-associated phospholipid phosphatase
MHASYITFVVITFNILLGPWMLLLLPLIPIVGWARIRAKRHTKHQVLTGAGLASVICVLGYYFYGFISL